MTDERFAQVAVIGTGAMGPGIALALAQGGCRVTMVGRSPASVDRGLTRLDGVLAFMVKHHLLAAGDASRLRVLVEATDDLESAVAPAGLVQESIAEDLQQKRDLFGRLERLCSPQTLLTSDTSGLLISDIVEGLAHPERTATMHFWNPPHLVPLVEVSKGLHTSDQTVEALVVLLRRCGKAPAVARKDVPGQIANRLQHALVREALFMVQEGIASAEDIDLALKLGPGRRWPVYGLLEHQDVVGLDVILAIQRSLVPSLCSATTPLPILEEKVAGGDLGIKTGHGLYDWSTRDPQAVIARRDAFLCMMALDWPDPDARPL